MAEFKETAVAAKKAGRPSIAPGPYGRFSCDLCQKSYKRLNELTTHNKSHEQQGSFCFFCGQVFAMEKDLRRHMDVDERKWCKKVSKSPFEMNPNMSQAQKDIVEAGVKNKIAVGLETQGRVAWQCYMEELTEEKRHAYQQLYDNLQNFSTINQRSLWRDYMSLPPPPPPQQQAPVPVARPVLPLPAAEGRPPSAPAAAEGRQQ